MGREGEVRMIERAKATWIGSLETMWNLAVHANGRHGSGSSLGKCESSLITISATSTSRFFLTWNLGCHRKWSSCDLSHP